MRALPPLRWPPGAHTRGSSRRSPATGLEEFDRVSGRIVEQNLRAAGAGHDFISKPYASGAQPFNLSDDAVDDEMDSVPPAGSGSPAVGHRSSRRARRPAQQQPQVTACDLSERRRRGGKHLEIEVFGVEGDG